MKSVQPEVFLVARPEIDYPALAGYLHEVGGDRWLEKLDKGELNDAQSLAEFAGRLCYRSWEPGLNPNVTRVRAGQQNYLQNSILANLHGSVLEHVSFSFVLHNVSRVLTHELVRHRPGTAVSQESLRFVRLADIPFWFPEWARGDAELMQRATDLLGQMEEFQRWMAGHFRLDEDGVPFGEKKHRRRSCAGCAGRGGHRTALDGEYPHPAAHHRGPHRHRRRGGDPARLHQDRGADAGRGAGLFGDYAVEDGAWIPRWRKV